VPLHANVPGASGKRYTLAIQVVFERDGLVERDGALVVEAKFPLIASLESTKVTGWLDPQEPPTVLYGQSTNPNARRPAVAGPAELVAERLVGPFLAPFDQPLSYAIDLGADRIQTARVKEARVVVYDDALPPNITVAFVAAGLGLVTLLSGTVMLVFGRRKRTTRGGGGKRSQPPPRTTPQD
jgi:hypothetical protein